MYLLWLIHLYFHISCLMVLDILLELRTELVNVFGNCCVIIGVDELVHGAFAVLGLAYFIFI